MHDEAIPCMLLKTQRDCFSAESADRNDIAITMLTIIHGDDITLSRKYFLEQKQKYQNSILLEGEKIDLTDLTQILEGGGLFGSQKYIFIEQLIGKRQKSSDFKHIAAYLQKNASENHLYLWEGKEITKSALAIFKEATVRIFKLPQTLFVFLDSIKPAGEKTLISLLHRSLEAADEEMIFYMLIRHIRLLLAISNSTNDPIEEVKRLAPWQKSKLQKQSALFRKEKLIEFYQKLFQIEVKLKTGNLSHSLTSAIDFLLLEL